MPLNLSMPSTSIIHGDATSASIAAASIVAKVTRDHMMDELDDLYPMYGFKKLISKEIILLNIIHPKKILKTDQLKTLKPIITLKNISKINIPIVNKQL